jgi:uncharacterized membrane protein YfcA
VTDLVPDIIALLCSAAVAAGFVDAIAGGGGLIMIPALLAAGVSPVAAIATNKVQGCVGTASATYTFWRGGWIDFRLLRVPLLAALAGAAVGATALMVIDTRWLMVVLPLLLVGIFTRCWMDMDEVRRLPANATRCSIQRSAGNGADESADASQRLRARRIRVT